MDSKTGWTRRLLAAALTALLTLTAALSQAEETITYIHWDAQGSPVAATDEDGNVERGRCGFRLEPHEKPDTSRF